MTGSYFRLPALVCAALMVCFGVGATMTFSRLDIAVKLNANGSADFEELWELSHDGKDGTELYFTRLLKPPYRLADFSVSENGVSFERVDPWVVETSLQEKTHRCGVRKSESNYEFCWGIGSPGQHRYKLKYTIDNFVRQCNDNTALLYHTIFTAGNVIPRKLDIRVSSAGKPFSESEIIDKSTNGIVDLTFDDGVFHLTPNVELDKGAYMVLRVEFDRNAFDSLCNAGADIVVTPEELSSPMMSITKTADATNSLWDHFWDFYDRWPNVTLLLLIGGLLGLFYLIKKIWIALI